MEVSALLFDTSFQKQQVSTVKKKQITSKTNNMTKQKVVENEQVHKGAVQQNRRGRPKVWIQFHHNDKCYLPIAGKIVEIDVATVQRSSVKSKIEKPKKQPLVSNNKTASNTTRQQILPSLSELLASIGHLEHVSRPAPSQSAPLDHGQVIATHRVNHVSIC